MAYIWKSSILLSAILSIIINPWKMIQSQQVPCAFFFGDSLFDNGNNNNLNTHAKANFLPYGVDFPSGPTGRFTNGENIADFLAKFLGFAESIPPYASARDILKGVNYASGGAGIFKETGSRLGDRIWMSRQLKRHQQTITRLEPLIGNTTEVTNYLNKCLYTLNIGNNDYLNNFLLPGSYPSSSLFTPEFAEKLTQKYSQQLKKLYSMGARKIAVLGLGLIGCVLEEVDAFPPPKGSPCVDFVNNYAKQFNDRLVKVVDNLNNDENLKGASFTYINITSITQGDPSSIGVTMFNKPCCSVQENGQCLEGKVPCDERSKYVFFDKFHPVSFLNFITATKCYNATLPSDASPYDIRHLIMQ